MKKKIYWTVKFGIDHSWVADGFELTNERVKGMLAKTLLYAHNSEISARVIGKPDRKVIRRIQGY